MRLADRPTDSLTVRAEVLGGGLDQETQVLGRDVLGPDEEPHDVVGQLDERRVLELWDEVVVVVAVGYWGGLVEHTRPCQISGLKPGRSIVDPPP